MKNLLNFIKLNWFNMLIILVTDVIFPYIISKFEFNETINLIILIKTTFFNFYLSLYLI